MIVRVVDTEQYKQYQIRIQKVGKRYSAQVLLPNAGGTLGVMRTTYGRTADEARAAAQKWADNRTKGTCRG